MSTLLPPNSTALERAVEAATALDMNVSIADLWNPHTCPERALPWLAWALHVDTWDLARDTETQRAVIRESTRIHRLKGTRWAVRQALATLRIKSDITEWWQQQPPGPPHTFDLTAWVNENLTGDTAIISTLLYERLSNLIDEVKPVRSHYQFRIGALFLQPPMQVANAAQPAAVGRWSHEAQPVKPTPAQQPLRAANAQQTHAVARTSAEPLPVQPATSINPMRLAAVAQPLSVIRVSMEVQ